jgi:hypothetical protein
LFVPPYVFIQSVLGACAESAGATTSVVKKMSEYTFGCASEIASHG